VHFLPGPGRVHFCLYRTRPGPGYIVCLYLSWVHFVFVPGPAGYFLFVCTRAGGVHFFTGIVVALLACPRRNETCL
jgi:hypothetical protein